MIRAPYQIVKKTATDKPISALDAGLGFAQIAKIAGELEALKKKGDDILTAHEQDSKERVKKLTDQISRDFQAKLDQLDAVVRRVASTVMKGDPGDDADPVDEEALAQRVMQRIRVPQDGETPVVDYARIAKMAANLIPKPKDGKSPKNLDPQAIADMVVDQIVKNKKVKAHQIDGWQDAEAVVRRFIAAGSIRGGGDTVAAGTNVTISTSNGVKTINASGGGGFTKLTATETPNGTLTVFTFAAAAAKPSFILSDHVWMPATDADGVTVNWTWNNGTKKATMTIPPNNDILGIV